MSTIFYQIGSTIIERIENMRYSEAMECLQNLIGYKPSAKELVHILGLNSPKTLYQRAHRDSEFTDLEIKTLFEHYDPSSKISSPTFADKVEIPYYTNPNLKTDIKNPLVTSMWFDRELVENVWKKDPKNLRIIKMLGDKMHYGEYPLRNDDILIMDISETDPFIAGTYVFTTNNDKYIFICRVSRLMDGSYKFTFLNPACPDRIETPEEAEELGLKIVGKIVKNLSLTI